MMVVQEPHSNQIQGLQARCWQCYDVIMCLLWKLEFTKIESGVVTVTRWERRWTWPATAEVRGNWTEDILSLDTPQAAVRQQTCSGQSTGRRWGRILWALQTVSVADLRPVRQKTLQTVGQQLSGERGGGGWLLHCLFLWRVSGGGALRLWTTEEGWDQR